MPSPLFTSVSGISADHEYYTPLPKGYRPGKAKYIIVTGSVMSGLGKGIFSASLGRVLQEHGYRCSPIKFDGYLNIDAGTLNPYRHGEVFVLDDGTETDMDLGTYERMLGISLTRDNYLTGGKIFHKVLSQEREGSYLGRDVQFIPHVTGEIKRFLRHLAMSSKADFVLMEVGGTVGDIENEYFIEAMRQLAYEEGKQNVCFINVTYILEPGFLGEQKSKAAQLGIKRLMELGIQPDIIACRATNEVTEKVREKISIFSNVPVENVVSMHDVSSIYLIPGMIKQTRLDRRILDIMHVSHQRKRQGDGRWPRFIRNIQKPEREVAIGITGKYTALRDSYASIIQAVEHAAAALRCRANIKWIDTEKVTPQNAAEMLAGIAGIIVPGGFGKRGAEGKIACIQYAREHQIPYLGLCFGFQLALVEFARHVLKMKDADSTELEPKTKHPVIDILPEQEHLASLGGNMRLGGHDVLVMPGSRAHGIYGSGKIRERFRHRYECNPKYIPAFENAGLVFSGKASENAGKIMQILELPNHPFFIGVQFHPEFLSRPLQPHPLYAEFLRACIPSA
ncbi:MAG TPA: CTP synthase [Candidatus Nanoarchaeia archaeon]|nr:CTP synthase [Candidatus Nanoarchaeia archaeon]